MKGRSTKGMSPRETRLAGMIEMGMTEREAVLVDDTVQQQVKDVFKSAFGLIHDAIPEKLHIVAESAFVGALVGEGLDYRAALVEKIRGTAQ